MPKVLNRERLRAKLKALPDTVKRRIKEPMEKSAQEIADLAYHLAPVATGALRNSIDWSWGAPPAGSSLGAGKTEPPVQQNEFKLSIYAGNSIVYYARFVEFGTGPSTKGQRITNKSGRSRKAQRSHPGTAAQPFFYPAWRALKTQTKKKITSGVNRALKEVANK